MPDRPRSLTAVLLALLVFVGACGMPTSERATEIELDEEYAELLQPAPTTASTTTAPPEVTREVGLYFIEDDTLSRVGESMPRSRALSLTAVLNSLTQGTLRENHRTAIPDGVTVVNTRIDESRRTAVIELADTGLFSRVEGNDRLRAIAQFVFTATAPGRNGFDVEQVQFEVDGEIRTIPTVGAADTSEPVGRCDYYRLARPVDVRDCPDQTTTTTTTATTTTGPALDLPAE